MQKVGTETESRKPCLGGPARPWQGVDLSAMDKIFKDVKPKKDMLLVGF